MIFFLSPTNFIHSHNSDFCPPLSLSFHFVRPVYIIKKCVCVLSFKKFMKEKSENKTRQIVRKCKNYSHIFFYKSKKKSMPICSRFSFFSLLVCNFYSLSLSLTHSALIKIIDVSSLSILFKKKSVSEKINF